MPKLPIKNKLLGRPSKYTPTIQAKADNYAKDYASHGHAVPSAVGLSLALDISKSTLYLWAEKYPSFSDTLEKCMAVQEMALVSNGLTGDFNSTITKLMLHNHGYSDKLAIGGDAENPLAIQQITRKVVE